jgi:1-deoxy-D-xylulose-5-phosphate reductoisomerase
VALTGGATSRGWPRSRGSCGRDRRLRRSPPACPELRDRLAGSGTEAAAGPEAIAEAADRPADWVMSAIVGAAGLVPGLRALAMGRTLALANKESLVTAGPLLMAEAASTARASCRSTASIRRSFRRW